MRLCNTHIRATSSTVLSDRRMQRNTDKQWDYGTDSSRVPSVRSVPRARGRDTETTGGEHTRHYAVCTSARASSDPEAGGS